MIYNKRSIGLQSMFEKLLQKLLKDVVGEFIDGIDTKKLNIGIWSGTVEIVNVSLKPRLLAILGLPYRITFSNISRLFITIPWKNLFTAPLVIQIDSILVLAENVTYQLTKQQQSKIILLKIKQFIQKLARQLASTKKSQQKGGGYFQSVYLKMLDNLYLTIRNIHFRFQVSRPFKQQLEATPFSFGITLQLIELFAVDEKGSRVFIDRTKLSSDKNVIYKKLKLQNFGFYWNFQQKQIIFLSLLGPSQGKKNEEKYYKQMLDLKQINAGKGLGKQKINYVVLINAEGIVKQDNRQTKNSTKITKYDISFVIRQFKMILNQRIVKEAVWFMKQTAFITAQKNSLPFAQFSDKWEGPKMQNFLGLLRKYCINQFWQTENSSNKASYALSSAEQKMLMDLLYEHRGNLDQIQTKIKEIIVGDIGSKHAINKSQIINNWHAIQDMMNEQKKNEGSIQLKFSFNLEEFCIFYVDEVKMPIAQLYLKGFVVTADQNQQKDLVLIIQMAKLEGFGYDQNPIIRMEHQIQSTVSKPKLTKIPKFFYMIYQSKNKGSKQEIQIDMGGIGFIYDFKTFRQLYKLPEGLITSQPTPNPISPASNSNPSQTVENAPSQNLQIKNEEAARFTLNKERESKPDQYQITITVQNISVYIQQYTKKTWRLSLSGCQMTNSQSFIPQNILISALSLSISDFYVIEPFSTKIFLNLRGQMTDISLLVEPVQVKISNDGLKNLMKIPSCLQTYKKNDAISLSAKYGQLFLLYDKQVWKKYDGVVIDGFLYLYQKNEEYSKYQLKVVEAAKKQISKRQAIQITVRQDLNKQPQKLILIVKNTTQYGEWVKYLQDLAEVNRKYYAKSEQRMQQIKANKQAQMIMNMSTNMNMNTKNEQKDKKPASSKLKLNLIVQQVKLMMVVQPSQKQYEGIFYFVVRKTCLQFGSEVQAVTQQKIGQEQPVIENKLSKKDKVSQQRFQSFKQIKFSSQFSKNSLQQHTSIQQKLNESVPQNKTKQKNKNKQEVVQIIKIKIQSMQLWYRKQRRLYFQQAQENSICLDVRLRAYETEIKCKMNNKLIFIYQPYQILQIFSYLNSEIFNLFTPASKNKVKTTTGAGTGTKQNQSKVSAGNGSNQNIEVKIQDIQLVEARKSYTKIELSIASGMEIICYSLLTYPRIGQQIKNIGKKRTQVIRISTQKLGFQMNEKGIKVEISDLSAIWIPEFQQENIKSHVLVQSFGKKNKIVVSMQDSKMIVIVQGLFLPNYRHYLTMRAIDYLLGQLKQPLLYPFNFNQYFAQFSKSEGAAGTHTKMFRFKQYLQSKMTESQIWQRVRSLLQMDITINEGYVGFADGFITVGTIRITNSFVESYNYSIQDRILCDQYLIEFKDLNARLVDHKNIKQKEMGKKEENKSQELYSQLTKQFSKISEANKKQNPTSKVQQQRFYTVLNRFSNTINEKQFEERTNLITIPLISPQCPLDMSLIVTMFGKYPQYKTIFQKFQPTIANLTMRIKMKLSEVHINILPKQVHLFLNFINEITNNIFYTDNLNYRYSYDEKIVKQIYKQQFQKDGKKLEYKNGQPIIVTPIDKILKQQEYLYYPMQFHLGIKNLWCSVVVLPNLVAKKPSQMSKSAVRLTQKGLPEPKYQQNGLMGIQTNVQSLVVSYVQYPETQTSISFNLLQTSNICNGNRTKILSLTSAAERISRQTMFIDYSTYNKKQDNSASKANLSKINNEANNEPVQAPQIKIHEKQRDNQSKKKQNEKSAKQANQVEQKMAKNQQFKEEKQKKQKDHENEAFFFKMSTNVKKQLIEELNIATEKKQKKQVKVNVKMFQLVFQNIILAYDYSFLNCISKIQSAIKQSNNENETKQKQQPAQIHQKQNNQLPSEKKQIICRLYNFMVKMPIVGKYPIAQPNDGSFKNLSLVDENICMIVRATFKTILPENYPMNLDISYLQIFQQQIYHDFSAQEGKRKSIVMKFSQKLINLNEENKNLSVEAKNRKKTLLQPTKVRINRRIATQTITKVKTKPKQQVEPPLMTSRIKSLLNLTAGTNNDDKNLPKPEPQFVTNKFISQQIQIDKCFVKISIQDLQVLSKVANEISSQISKFYAKNQPVQGQKKQIQKIQKKVIKQKKNTQIISKKGSIQESMGQKQKNMQVSKSMQNIFKAQKQKSERKSIKQSRILQQQLNEKQAESPLQIRNIFQFNPFEIVIMNNSNVTNTPLIYAKLQIIDYEGSGFNLEIAANYFNLRINAWQPLIEQNILVIKLQPHLSIQKLFNQESKQQKQKQGEKKPEEMQQQDKPKSQIIVKRSQITTNTYPSLATAQQRLNSYLNINISTNFLQVLIPSLQSKTSEIAMNRMSETKSVGDQVNCWMLINELGYDINCQSKSFKSSKMSMSITIPNNKSKKLTFLNDMFDNQGFEAVMNSDAYQARSQIFNLDNEKDKDKKGKFTISITINNEFKIKQIQIGEIGIKKFCFNYDGNPYWIYGHTYMDISKNVKYVKFYSEFLIKNNTNMDIWVKLPLNEGIGNNKPQQKQQDQNIKNLNINEKQKKQRKYSYNFQPTPITTPGSQANSNLLNVNFNRNKSDHFENDVSQNSSMNERLETSFKKAHTHRPNYVRIPSNKELSLAFDIDQSFKKLDQKQFAKLLSKELPQPQQQLHSPKQQNQNNIEKYSEFQIQKQRKKMRTIYKILPVGKLINKLPQTLNLALKADQHILYSFTMRQDEPEFVYTSFGALQISMHTDGFQWTQFMPCNIVQNITLLDFNNNKLVVKTYGFHDEDGIYTVIFYPISVLYNDTDYCIKIRDPQSKNYSFSRVLPKKGISLSNNRVLVLKPDLPKQTGFTSQQTSYTKIYMNQDEIACKFQINSLKSEASQKQLSHIPPTAFQTFLINQVSLKTSSAGSTSLLAQGISTKFVTASHKYYFKNETQHIILIRKYTGSDSANRTKSSNFSVREYQPFSSQSFWLFEEDATSNTQNLAYYQLTIKNSPYEWSGALSPTSTGSNHFILRNRAHFNDVLFMNLSVIKYRKIQKYKMELKMVAREEVPFKIKNNFPGFSIKLPEYGNIILKEGDQIDYSWDEPVIKNGSIIILIAPQNQSNFDKLNYTRFEIKTENSQLNELVKIKKSQSMAQIYVTHNNFTKIFEIRQYHKIERQSQRLVSQIDLPIRIAIINNSFTPVYHLCDMSTNLSLKILKIREETLVRLNLESIQLDNQTRYRVYFPVVLSTSLSINATIGRNIQLQLLTKPVILNIEQDFGKDLYATAMLIMTLNSDKKGIQSQIHKVENEVQSNSKVLISKLILPQVSISLQIKTKKLSIETTINLQKPTPTRYPFPNSTFPYPIKNIVINLLSHLSISPWALISSFQKGVVSLLTQQESTRGIEGFFGQIIAALSNSVSGIVGVLVGHDIQRVDNFFDGIEQGGNLLLTQILDIKDSFEPQQFTLPSILKGVGIGIVSIVLKPLKGVLQMTLKISQGIKKTALYSFDQSENKFRQRDAIVFYGQQQKFRNYDAFQSQLLVLLLKACGQPLKYFHLLKFYVINNRLLNQAHVICIGTEQVIVINAKTQKLIWQLNLHEVSQIELIRYSTIKFRPHQYQIDAFHQDLAQQICNFLQKVQKKVFVKT